VTDSAGRGSAKNGSLSVLVVLAIAATGVAISLAGCRWTRRTARLDFESGDFSGWTEKFAASHSGRIVQSPVRRGKYAARFELRAGDDTGDGVRAELKEMHFAPLGREIWYSFSTFIPPDFPIVDTYTVISQWHASEDPGENAASRSPVLAHRYGEGTFVIDIRFSSTKIQRVNDGASKVLYQQKDFPKGVWHDFVYRVRWSYRSDGFVECWLDGKRIIDYQGPVGYNDNDGPYFKFGLYHQDGERPFVVYHDEYRRGFSREDVVSP
jgi:hypothetical protein